MPFFSRGSSATSQGNTHEGAHVKCSVTMILTMIRDLGSRMQKAPCCCCMGSRSIKEIKIRKKVGWTRRIDKTWSLCSVREKARKEHRLVDASRRKGGECHCWQLCAPSGGMITGELISNNKPILKIILVKQSLDGVLQFPEYNQNLR